jgi:hypothetical protein
MEERKKEAYIYLLYVLMQEIKELAERKYVSLHQAEEALEEIWDMIFTFHNFPCQIYKNADTFDEPWFWLFLNNRHSTRSGVFRREFERYLGNYSIEEFEFEEPWEKLTRQEQIQVINELNKELTKSHYLYGAIINALAKKGSLEVVLLEVFKDNAIFYAETKLTWESIPKKGSDTNGPLYTIYNTFEEWESSKIS